MATENFAGFDVISHPATDANSYVSVAETKSYWDLDPAKIGYTYTDEEIGRAVIHATSQLDAKYGSVYKGTLYDETYALFWPRTGVIDSRGIPITDYTIFPAELRKATSCQAFYSLELNVAGKSSVVANISGIKSQTLDGVGSKEYFSPAEQRSASIINPISDSCALALSSLIETGSSSKYVEFLLRG